MKDGDDGKTCNVVCGTKSMVEGNKIVRMGDGKDGCKGAGEEEKSEKVGKVQVGEMMVRLGKSTNKVKEVVIGKEVRGNVVGS